MDSEDKKNNSSREETNLKGNETSHNDEQGETSDVDENEIGNRAAKGRYAIGMFTLVRILKIISTATVAYLSKDLIAEIAVQTLDVVSKIFT